MIKADFSVHTKHIDTQFNYGVLMLQRNVKSEKVAENLVRSKLGECAGKPLRY